MKSRLLGVLLAFCLGTAQAASVTLTAVDGGTAFDADKDGTFDLIKDLEVTAGSDGGNNTSRALLEFDLSSISGPVTAATLTVGLGSIQYEGPATLDIEFHGYVGNGIVEPSDGLADNLITTIQVNPSSISSNIDVTSIVQPLPAYAGFMIRLADETPQEFQVFSSNSLAVDYSPVPIPPTLYLFGTGLIALVGMAKRKAA